MVEELGFALKGVTSLYNSRTTYSELLALWLYLYPWHLCRRVYSFCLSVRSLVGSFILPLCLWNFMSNFMLKFLQVGLSLQLLIRKHSYLDHEYLGGSASLPLSSGPRVHTLGWGLR